MVVPPFWQDKYKKEASRNWDKFYRRNTTKFFKDRHWLLKEFPRLSELSPEKCLLEVGCGVGNLVFPMAEDYGCRIVAVDFAKTAIGLLVKDERFDEERMRGIVHDFTMGPLDEETRYDLITMIFVLSAVPPEKHITFLKNVALSLGSGNCILFRDYAAEDAAQKRFADQNRISDELFVRQDGTLSYFFDLEYMDRTAWEAGLEMVEGRYVESETVNVKEGLWVPRRFLQCMFIKHQ